MACLEMLIVSSLANDKLPLVSDVNFFAAFLLIFQIL